MFRLARPIVLIGTCSAAIGVLVAIHDSAVVLYRALARSVLSLILLYCGFGAAPRYFACIVGVFTLCILNWAVGRMAGDWHAQAFPKAFLASLTAVLCFGIAITGSALALSRRFHLVELRRFRTGALDERRPFTFTVAQSLIALGVISVILGATKMATAEVRRDLIFWPGVPPAVGAIYSWPGALCIAASALSTRRPVAPAIIAALLNIYLGLLHTYLIAGLDVESCIGRLLFEAEVSFAMLLVLVPFRNAGYRLVWKCERVL